MKSSFLPSIVSTTLLALAIIVLPDQFLFSKFVPNSFWVEYFPVPFGAGWFISFLLLTPAIWLADSTIKAARAGLGTLLLSVLLAVPVSILVAGHNLTLNNLLNQYIWVSIMTFPPYLVQLSLRWFFYILKKGL